jgi:hypothetical protein
MGSRAMAGDSSRASRGDALPEWPAEQIERWPLEVWRAIPGFDGYEASSRGRIRSIDRSILIRSPNGTEYRRPVRGRVLVPWRAGSHRRYWYVDLGGVHRLCALAFCGRPPSEKHEAAHQNGDSLDNTATNLRWATRLENEYDKLEHGTYFTRAGLKGEAHHKAKLTAVDIATIRSEWRGERGQLGIIAQRYGVNRSTISRVCKGTGWAHV